MADVLDGVALAPPPVVPGSGGGGLRIVLSNASYAWGGVHVVTEALALGLRARGHAVTVFCRPDSPLQARLTGRVPLEPVARGMDLSPLAIARAAAALRRHRPDVVLTLMEKDVRLTGPAARALGIPVVVRRANDRPLKRTPHFRVLYGWLPALHVANSASTRRTMLQSAPWLRPERVRMIHNGVDAAALDTLSPADLGLPPGALGIGFVGRFDERKGILDLARAWPAVAAALPHTHLVMVGTGPEEAGAGALLAVAPRVRWLGYRADAVAVIKALDVLAVPSHWEGFGLVVAEALAVGTPVVAADASSLPEIVRPGAEGLLVPPRDPDALAAALVTLARDDAMRARMAAAGRARIRAEFSLAAMIDRYEALLTEVVSAHRP
ncbi:glycosyltransferase [Longimicrobium sp.]|uniref:glycosyltransferase n=1 Tax=Longimicrobium sp. TaxID=2029185 RepID=UPI002E2F098C|nr:glycosyltransferase [Longimicrobium sp.]HEX6039065.1 glycosyltransferase [Longimicrobium sp.]